MPYIPTNEIKKPDIHADELGFVFIWNGHLLRGIYKKSVKQAYSYFESGFIDEIVREELFPKTWISDFENEIFGIIIEHELLSPSVYSTEWNLQMLIDASKAVVNIAVIGLKYGYNMIDCHTSNVMFYNNHPYYVDLGSFVSSTNTKAWKPYTSFCRSYLSIIDLWTMGASQISKRILSPGMELNSFDYYVLKYPLFRHMNFFLSKFIYLREAIYALASFEDIVLKDVVNDKNKLSKKSILLFQKFLSTAKPLNSQNLNVVVNKIKDYPISIVHSKIPGNDIIITFYEFLKKENCSSLTLINNQFIDMPELLHTEFPQLPIYSIQDSNEKSIEEYNYYRNHQRFTSLHFKTYSGYYNVGIPVNKRINSNISCLFLDINDTDVFNIHNSLVKTKKAIAYSNKKTSIIFVQNNQDLISKLAKEYAIKECRVFGNDILIMISEK